MHLNLTFNIELTKWWQTYRKYHLKLIDFLFCFGSIYLLFSFFLHSLSISLSLSLLSTLSIFLYSLLSIPHYLILLSSISLLNHFSFFPSISFFISYFLPFSFTSFPFLPFLSFSLTYYLSICLLVSPSYSLSSYVIFHVCLSLPIFFYMY